MPPEADHPGQALTRPVAWLVKGCAAAVSVMAVLWVVDLPYYLGVALFREQFMMAIFACGLAIVFLTTRADRTVRGPVPWYDAAAALVAVATLAATIASFQFLHEDVVGFRGWQAIAVGTVLVPLTLEALRRAAGYTLLVVVLAFIGYAFVADAIPGSLKGTPIELDNFFIYLAFDPTAIFGTPMIIGTQIVIVFILFGQLLVKTGGGEFFTDIAMAAMGRSRGGAAKIAVVASALFGSISGSAISNVASTGVITIPLMRRSGYTPVQAGAVEAVASTGGQFMPPIMGAAAFLMAEYLEVPYSDVVVAAIIPALLYYFAVFVEVDLIAARDHVRVVEGELPRVSRVLTEGWQFLVPFAVLLVDMFYFVDEAHHAALYASAAVILFGAARGYKGQRMTPRALWDAMCETGSIMVELLAILAAAGIVIGILNYTTLGFAFTLALAKLGGGNLAVLLVIAAVASIVLGMGMPTSGIYVLLASLIVPALIETGVVPMGAHLFILYFGMMSMLTPPVCLCAFTAGSIARADPMQIGFAAMRFAWPAYIVPFLFCVAPTLLMVGAPAEILFDAATAFIGVYLVSVAMVGFFVRRLNVVARLAVAAGGFASLMPAALIPSEHLVNGAGILLGGGWLLCEHLAMRRRHATVAE